MSEHLSDVELSELLREEGDLEDLVPHVLHLVTCTTCRERFGKDRAEDLSLLVRRIFGRPDLPPVPRHREATALWRGLLDRCLPKVDRALWERQQAETLWNEAASWPAARQLLEVTNRNRFHTLGFVYRVMDAVERLQKRDPQGADAWCEIARRVVERLSPERYGERPLEDVRARICAHRGNCWRILNDLARADRYFQQAATHLDQGSGEPLEQAQVYFLEASLRRDQRRHAEARELLRLAADVYRSIRDPRRLAAVVIQEAMICRDQGDPEAGIEALEVLSVEIEVEELDLELRFVLEGNLTTYLTEAGYVDEAGRRLPGLRRLTSQLGGDRLDLHTRLHWLEAMVRERQGRLEEAETHYSTAREGFLQEGMTYDGALVSLDLAALYLDQERFAEASRLAREMSPLLWEADLHGDAVAALMLFLRATSQETATGAFARKVGDTLRKCRHRPPAQAGLH